MWQIAKLVAEELKLQSNRVDPKFISKLSPFEECAGVQDLHWIIGLTADPKTSWIVAMSRPSKCDLECSVLALIHAARRISRYSLSVSSIQHIDSATAF